MSDYLKGVRIPMNVHPDDVQDSISYMVESLHRRQPEVPTSMPLKRAQQIAAHRMGMPIAETQNNMTMDWLQRYLNMDTGRDPLCSYCRARCECAVRLSATSEEYLIRVYCNTGHPNTRYELRVTAPSALDHFNDNPGAILDMVRDQISNQRYNYLEWLRSEIRMTEEQLKNLRIHHVEYVLCSDPEVKARISSGAMHELRSMGLHIPGDDFDPLRPVPDLKALCQVVGLPVK